MSYMHVWRRHTVLAGPLVHRAAVKLAWATITQVDDIRRFTAFSLPGPFAPRSESANRTWPIRSLALSLLGPFAPWPFRSQEWNGRPFCSRERKFLRTFAPWKFGSRNFPFVDPGYCYAICTYSRLVALPLLPAEPNISNQLSTTSVTVYPMTCTSAWRHWWPTSTTTGSAASCGQPARGVLFSRPLEQTMTWKGGTTGCTRCHATAN